eukprot:8224414-Alexandrium_andersonii.AAC.1
MRGGYLKACTSHATRIGGNFLPVWATLERSQQAQGFELDADGQVARGFAYANVALQEMSAVPNGVIYAFVLLLAILLFSTSACCFRVGRWSAKRHWRRLGAEWGERRARRSRSSGRAAAART